MATPTGLKYLNSDSYAVTRSTRRNLELNARDNGVSDNRHQTKGFILPNSNNNSVLTRSRSKNLQSFAGEYEIPGDSRERKSNIHRKKNILLVPDLSKCSTVPLRDDELVPEGLKKEAEWPSPYPLLKKSQDSTCVKDESGKSGYSPVHCETEMQPSTTVSQNDLSSETSAKGENTSKHVLITPYKHAKGTSKGQNETTRWESPSTTTIQSDINSETSAKGEDASKHVLITPCKHPRGTSKVKSATKLPNFASIHKKQFEKMESVIEWKQRKQIRSNRMLMSPTAKIPEPSLLTENVFKFTAMQKSSIENEGIQDLNIKKKALNLQEIKKFRSKQNVITAQAKESVIKKLTHASREQKRVQERTYLKGVRLNKRFHLQMEMRKLC